jgi:Uma2 family endonuclease
VVVCYQEESVMAVAPPLTISPLRESYRLEDWEDESEEEEFYITSDGKPMAETELPRDLMTYSIEGLRARFIGQDVHVSGNSFIHYREGDRKAHIAPDCYVVFGVASYRRNCYKVWEEGGHFPDVIIEFISRETRKKDFGKNKDLYEQIFQTAEYFTFDPTGVRKKVRLKGFRLRDGKYEERTPEADGRLHSEKLGFDLIPEGTWLRFYDPVTKEFLRTHQESEEEAQRAETEARRAREAEAENERLRAELEQLRRQVDQY